MEKTNINSMYVSRVTIGDIRRRVRPGRLVRVKWTDTGATDCIVVEKESEGKVTKL
jgi:predicted aspartyl protease